MGDECSPRPTIEIVRVPSIERAGFRPLDGVQLRAAYSHVRLGTYCPEPAEAPAARGRSPRGPPQDVKPPAEQSRRYKKNLGPVSRLLRRRHHATSLATKSCDNIYSVNKANSFVEWKHAHGAGHDQERQSNSLDWRVGRRIDKNSSNFECRKASRSAEQLSRSSTLQTPSTKSKLVSLLRRLSPRLPRPSSKNSLPSSPSICPWVRVEYSNVDATDGTGAHEQQQQSTQETDYSFQRELQLNEMRKRAIKASDSRQELANDAATISTEKTSPRPCAQSNVHIQEKQASNPKLRDVAEERGPSEERGQQVVAGPGEPGPLPRTSRRSRPHSLAVQPLHYQRLDPEQPPPQQQPAERPARRPDMTSQESIGSCSLDVERSASDRSADLTAGSLSEKTLHSLNLSCNGDEELDKPAKPRIEVTREQEEGQHGEAAGSQPSNGRRSRKPVASAAEAAEAAEGSPLEDGDEQLTSKKPSYLGLACSINGYSGITRYDSKLREGFRSRDSSPGARLLTRDTSPAGLRSNETIDSAPHSLPPKSQSISPLAMERHPRANGLANGVARGKAEIESHLESRGSTRGSTRASAATQQGYSEVDRGLGAAHAGLGPVRGLATSPNKRAAAYDRRNEPFASSSLTSSSPRSTRFIVSHASYTETSSSSGIPNGSSGGENGAANGSSEKSFIQQRVERLYGPGALAQGFFFKRTSSSSSSAAFSKLNASDPANYETSNNNNTSIIDDTNVEQSLRNLPVLRHLRPEFRAQLPVVSPRKPTDGTEQIIKPLKRISVSPAKNDAKETKSSPVKMENDAKNDSKMTASVTSLTDQQPAAPKVVLPVLEPSASSTNVPKGAEPPKEVKEKDGHYFMNLLNKERDRLIVLAEKAEAELAGSGASALPEEAAGKFRSAAGKARLLATQKMKQFKGLCQKNIIQVPGEEFPTTNEDLAGFWDMVMLQVVQVNELFEMIERSRKSQWQEIIPEQKSATATPQNGSALKKRQTPASKAKSAANSEAARKAREAREQTRRQLLEEKRRAMRSNANKSDNSVEIFVPDT